ncbi:MAG: IS1-like element transposase [Candidatus Tectomicrobia bacterium]|nr:IS1-like element transposase [Candidatus Tectomicrobia bacterium]
MSLNGSGVRDTARVLGISPTTVIHELKKRACAHLRQPAFLKGVTLERGGRDRPSG